MSKERKNKKLKVKKNYFKTMNLKDEEDNSRIIQRHRKAE